MNTLQPAISVAQAVSLSYVEGCNAVIAHMSMPDHPKVGDNPKTRAY
jgi:hypothetical protein